MVTANVLVAVPPPPYVPEFVIPVEYSLPVAVVENLSG